jgi:hypothetical protein
MTIEYTPKSIEDARRGGAEAYQAAISYGDNPYLPKTPHYSAWADGWSEEAKTDNEKTYGPNS